MKGDFMSEKPVIVFRKDIPPIETDWGSLQWVVTGKKGSSQNMTIGRVTIKPNKSNPHHYHPNCEEVLHLVAGEIEHTLAGDETVRMRAGDTIVVPENVWHHATNVGEEDAVMIVSFNNAWRETIGE
jgi:quercetin dioxygenase-like cupin family protein